MAKDGNQVGYGKPPKKYQFKPGQSGNPRGRPKGTKNLKTDLEEELKESITVTEGGKPKKLSKQRALLKSLMAKALKGDTKAVGILVGMVDRYIHASAGTDSEDRITNESDANILEAFKAEVLAEKTNEKK